MAAKNNSVTIRMGAAHWDVTIHGAAGDTTLDLRSMDRKGRAQFHGQFMASVRRYLRKGR